MSTVLAIDAGGTNLRLAAIETDSGKILANHRETTQFSTRDIHPVSLLETLARAAHPLLEQYPDIEHVGMGFPGFFIGHTGRLSASPNLPQMKNLDLAGQLSRHLDRSVSVQNDALCAAIGEQRYGAGKGKPNLIHVTLGTGIGGGLILNNRPYLGSLGMAMEIGHLQVEEGEAARQCGCGQSGCLEAHASATALSRQYQESTGETVTAKQLFLQAESGDPLAGQLFEQTGRYLGKALAHCVKILDIHHVTISGGPTGAWSLLYPPLFETLQDQVLSPQRQAIQVKASNLNDQAGLLGAAALTFLSA